VNFKAELKIYAAVLRVLSIVSGLAGIWELSSGKLTFGFSMLLLSLEAALTPYIFSQLTNKLGDD